VIKNGEAAFETFRRRFYGGAKELDTVFDLEFSWDVPTVGPASLFSLRVPLREGRLVTLRLDLIMMESPSPTGFMID